MLAPLLDARGPRPSRPRHLEVPDYGVGAGLRVPHYSAALQDQAPVGFWEVISENFFGLGGRPLYNLDRAKERYPLILHGVSLSIGGPDEPDPDYLARLKALVRRVQPAWVSDHFCFCGAGGAHLHELLPLPYTEESVARVARRARTIQDYLEVPFGLENTSSYLTYKSSTLTEWQFVTEVAERADCGLLLDVNNIYVSAFNHGFQPLEFLRNLPLERVLQIHLAGHAHRGTYILDTHDGPVSDPVLALYREALRLGGPVSTLLEWDENLPDFAQLLAEVSRIRQERALVVSSSAPPTLEVEFSIPRPTPSEQPSATAGLRERKPEAAGNASHLQGVGE